MSMPDIQRTLIPNSSVQGKNVLSKMTERSKNSKKAFKRPLVRFVLFWEGRNKNVLERIPHSIIIKSSFRV